MIYLNNKDNVKYALDYFIGDHNALYVKVLRVTPAQTLCQITKDLGD